jgi:hypothetical protein
MAGRKKTVVRARRGGEASVGRRCGLCGKAGKLVQTECCGQWICDDEAEYVLFSYARNSCDRNHRRYTLCGYHHAEGHSGTWQDCPSCRNEFEMELYVYYGTNEYNFEKLENPPAYQPTKCSGCDAVIRLGEDGYSIQRNRYWCERCSGERLKGLRR